MLKPEVLDALLAAGATAEMIVAAVKADMANDEKRAIEKRAKDAARQRKSRANRAGHTMSRNVTVTECDPPNDIYSNPPVSSDEETLAPVRRVKAGLPKPEGVSEQVWTDFLAHRKAKRAPVSQTVIDGIGREAEKIGWTLEAALAELVAQGWQGFKAEWTMRDAAKGFPKMVNTPADVDPVITAIRAKRAALVPP